MYEIDADTSELKVTEDFASPSCEELKSLETWGTLHPNILNAHRTSHLAPVEMDDEEAEAYIARMAEGGDVPQERFRSISEHEPFPGTKQNEEDPGTSWTSRVVGDT